MCSYAHRCARRWTLRLSSTFELSLPGPRGPRAGAASAHYPRSASMSMRILIAWPCRIRSKPSSHRSSGRMRLTSRRSRSPLASSRQCLLQLLGRELETPNHVQLGVQERIPRGTAVVSGPHQADQPTLPPCALAQVARIRRRSRALHRHPHPAAGSGAHHVAQILTVDVHHWVAQSSANGSDSRNPAACPRR